MVSSSLFGRYGLAIALLLIATTALLIYSHILSSPFYFDDEPNIILNNQLRDWGSLWPPSGMRYIGVLSFALNYHFGQLNTFGYHLVNIAIHILNGFLVWWLILLTFKTPVMQRLTGLSPFKCFIALFCALIFIVHPIQTQAVTYIVQRFASLATLFFLLALTLYIQARLLNQNIGKRSHLPVPPKIINIKSLLCYLGSIASTVLAMRTKEIAFTLPFIIVLYEFTFLSASNTELRISNLNRLYSLIPFLLALFIIPLNLIGADKPLGDIIGDLRQATQETEEIPRDIYLLTQFRVITTYLRLLFLPIRQNLDYDYPLAHSLFEPKTLFSFLLLLSIFTAALYLFKRSQRTGNGYGLLTSFGILWFFITLSVESSIIPIRDVIFEHRLYLPSVGAFMAFSAALFWAYDYTKPKLTPVAATCLLLLLTAIPLGIVAYQRNLVWKDEATLWQDVVEKSPNKARGHSNLGLVYYHRQRVAEAIQEYTTALQLKPNYPEAHHNLGLAYYNQGRLEEAIQEYTAALRLKPDFHEARHNLGVAYFNQGRLEEAIQEYTTILKQKPDYAAVHHNLGLVYFNQGKLQDAIKEYTTALQIKPDFPEAYHSLGFTYYKQGRLEEAIQEYIAALRLNPDYADAHLNLGTTYFNQGQLDEAMKEYTAVLRLKPDYADAHYNLGNTYKTKGLKDEAAREFEAVLKLRPNDPKARQALESLTSKH